MYGMLKHRQNGSFVAFCSRGCRQKWVAYVSDTAAKDAYEEVTEAVFGPWCAHCSYCGELLKRTGRRCIRHDECPTQANEFSIWPLLFVRRYLEAYDKQYVSAFKVDRLLFLMDGESFSPRDLYDSLCD